MTADTLTDRDLQQDVLDELVWEPRLEPGEIGVIADEGVITLSGFVDSYQKKIAAEQAAHRVRGVKAVANDLVVRLPAQAQRTDAELAQMVVHALEADADIELEALDVTVADGWVTLKGELPWRYQSDAAEHAVRALIGVKGITNIIRTRPNVKPSAIRKQIEQALVRSAETDARRIYVEVEGPRVILKGSVRTWAELRDAERVAWSAPGVESVDDRIVIMPEIE